MTLAMAMLFLVVSLIMFTAEAVDKLPPGVDREMYCETCLATVQEMKKTVKANGGEFSRTKIKAGMSKVCESLVLEEGSLAVARVACTHLLEVYEDKIEEAFRTEKEESLEANICYIHTRACIGVKRKALQDQQQIFDDKTIEDFIKKHGDRVRQSKPTAAVSESLQSEKDEL